MRPLTLALLGLTLATIARATPITITDPFPGSSCSDPASCDVVGSNERFDIQKVIVNLQPSGSQSTIEIYTNYGGTITQGSPNDTLNSYDFYGSLYVGDFLINAAGTLYGIALSDHVTNPAIAGIDPVTPGGLYLLDGVYTSNQLLPGSTSAYRQNTPVWLNPNGSALAVGTIQVESLGDPGGPQYKILVTIDFPVSVYALLESGWGFSFASATCANDIIDGNVPEQQTEIPEPGMMSLLGAALFGLGLAHRRRNG